MTLSMPVQKTNPPDPLTAETVLPLAATTMLGKSLYQLLPLTGSTNADAHRLGENGAPHGTLVVAETQTQGKGRQGRDWISPTGQGIYATLLLRPAGLAVEDIPLLTLLAAVAAVEAIDLTCPGLSPSIKWPNDILIQQRKVAGILSEAAYAGSTVDFVLIGIGINVNTPTEALPVRPLYPATSLAVEAGHPLSRHVLLAHWLTRMEDWLQKLMDGGHASLREQWMRYARMAGRHVTVQQLSETIQGTVTGIANDGALLLDAADGQTTRILSGDVC